MQAEAGSPPDVWLQLLELCSADEGCQPGLFRSLGQQLADQASVIPEQQRQLSDQQQKLDAQQGDIARLHTLLSALQGQVDILLQQAA